MPRSVQQAQPPLEFIPPALNIVVVRILQLLLPLIIWFRTALTDIQAENVEELVDLYRQFQAGKVRFLIAFRHPSIDDPLCLAHLLFRQVPQVAREKGVKLKPPIHAHCLYDRGIPLWAGKFMGWLYSSLGATPIHRGKIDLLGLRSARNLFANGEFPMAAAPEGATNGHSEIVSPLEPGISQLGFWCAEDLQKAGRTEEVLLVPLGIRYEYITPPWDAIDQLLTDLEADAGLPPIQSNSGESPEAFRYRRLYRLGEHLLRVMEDYYARFYHQSLPGVTTGKSKPVILTEPYTPIPNEEFATRLSALLDSALKVSEQFFNLQPKGSVIDRCRRLEQAAWDYIYREDFKQMETLSVLERGLADRLAEEADLRVWHMRIVESFVAVTGKYVAEKPTAERFAETTLLMWDMFARIKGGNSFKRPKLGAQRALLKVGKPLSVSERWGTYRESRKGAKQAIAELTQELQTVLEEMAMNGAD